MKIYTKTGDTGETGLFGGGRVPKDHLRIAAYGAVDEANAFLGLARTHAPPADLDAALARIQSELFVIGADLATPEQARARHKKPQEIAPADIQAQEELIDRLETELEPLKNFILPGGTPLAAALHVARTVVRRAERGVVTLSRVEKVRPNVVIYLNRLSDLLFVMARAANLRAGVADVPWVNR